MTKPLSLEGEVAIVTGAGNGLGRAYAFELAARGAAVVCNDVVASAAQATADEILLRGGKAVPETSSVSSADGGAAIVQAALDTFGSIDVLINNAGQVRNAAFEEMAVSDFNDVITTHLAGAFYVSQPAYRHMKAAGYGRMIFTSSSAIFGYPWQANYAAAKAGLIGLSHVIALEGAPFGIKSNAIMPMALGTSIENDGRPPYAPDQMEDMMQALRPIARYMTADNVAPLVVYLSSRSCSMTGRIFSVGCGHVALASIGVSRGWYAPDLMHTTAEEIAEHLEEACDPNSLATPESMSRELRIIAAHMPRQP